MSSNPRIDELRNRIGSDPKSRHFYPLGEELRKSGALEESEQVLRDGLAHHPNYLSAWISLGRVLRDQNKHREALEILQRAFSLDGSNVVTARLMAESYLEVGDKLEAIKKFKLVRALLPPDEELEAIISGLENELNPQPSPPPPTESEPAALPSTESVFAPPPFEDPEASPIAASDTEAEIDAAPPEQPETPGGLDHEPFGAGPFDEEPAVNAPSDDDAPFDVFADAPFPSMEQQPVVAASEHRGSESDPEHWQAPSAADQDSRETPDERNARAETARGEGSGDKALKLQRWLDRVRRNADVS